MMAVVAVSAISARACFADEKCNCDQYQSFTEFQSLAAQVAEVGIAGVSTEGKAFAASQEKFEALRLRIQANQLIPAECRQRLIEKLPKNFTDIVIRGMIAQGAQRQVFDTGPDLVAIHDSLYLSNFRYANPGCTVNAMRIPGKVPSSMN